MYFPYCVDPFAAPRDIAAHILCVETEALRSYLPAQGSRLIKAQACIYTPKSETFFRKKNEQLKAL